MKDIFLVNPPPAPGLVNAEENDLEFENGDLKMVDGRARKLQDLAMILETALGSDVVFPEYGSALGSVPGAIDQDATNRIRESVEQAIGFLAEVEQSSVPSERIAGIKSLSVTAVEGRPEARLMRLVVTMKDDQDLEYTQLLGG